MANQNDQILRKRWMFVFVIGFITGILTHYTYNLYSLESLRSQVGKNLRSAIGLPEPKIEGEKYSLVYEVKFDEAGFSPNSITIPVGRYISIRNAMSKTPMNLDSTEEYLQTPRPYGESERIYTSLPSIGTFVVLNEDNPLQSLVIEVK